MRKVQDFNGCWCEATEENYNALQKFTKYQDESIDNASKFESNFYIHGKTLNWGHKNCIGTLRDKNYWDKTKQIKLVNGEFYYVTDSNVGESKECSICGESKDICPSEETCSYRIEYEDTKREEMEECQFKKFGFEVPDNLEDFEYRLDYTDKIDNIVGTIDGCGSIWSSKGECIFTSHPSYEHFFNLTSIKKEWYDNKSNFPCVVTDGKYITVAHKVIKDGGEDILYGVYDGTLDGFLGGVQQFRPLTKEEVLKLLIKED